MPSPGGHKPSLPMKFLARSWPDRGLLLEALFNLAVIRVLLLALPFRRLAAGLGAAGVESAGALAEADEEVGRRIGWAVAAVARYVPWDSRCLAQALAGSRMLARRGLPFTVSLGVAEDPEKKGAQLFHAWLRCGRRPVTGGEGHRTYQVLALFSPKARKEGPGQS